MTVRPIIFSAPMVRALLDGRKTQTRRLATSPLAKCTPGDLLYVREGWQAMSEPGEYTRVCYKANSCNDEFDFVCPDGAIERRRVNKWRPSIHMPRWASRITLMVSEVQVQRLWEITDADAQAEGTVIVEGGLYPGEAYAQLWDHLHGPDAWRQNPEVVALTFTVHKQNIDDFLRQREAA